MEDLVQTGIDFICKLGSKAIESSKEAFSPDDDALIIQQTIQDLVDTSTEQPVQEVSFIIIDIYKSVKMDIRFFSKCEQTCKFVESQFWLLFYQIIH